MKGPWTNGGAWNPLLNDDGYIGPVLARAPALAPLFSFRPLPFEVVPVPARPSSRKASALPAVVLFDMDDTIFDHSLTCRAALERLRRERRFLRALPLDDLWHEYQRLLDATHTDVMLGRRTSDEVRRERFGRLAAMVGRTIPESEADDLSRTYRGYYQRLRRAVPGAPALLRRLHGRTQIGLVTNNTVAEQEEKLAFLGLDRTVDFLVASEAVGVTKPDPEIFRVALARARAPPANSVMVGDSWESDILGAHRAGLPVVWFNRFHRPRPTPLRVREFDSFRAPRRCEELLSAARSPEV